MAEAVKAGSELRNVPEPCPVRPDRAAVRALGHKKALFNEGIAPLQSGRPKDAAALWEDLLKRYPGDPQLAPLREQIAQVRGSAGAGS